MGEKEHNYYRSLAQEVWEDEELRKLKMTQPEVKAFLGAFERHIFKKLREDGEFRWKNVMVLRTKLVKGYNTYNITQGKQAKMEDYYRIQFRPSEKFKKNIKISKEDLLKLQDSKDESKD